MTEPMVTEEDREIARRWLSEGQINVDQMGRAAVLVAMRQEYRAALDEAFIQGLENAADIAKGERIEGILRRKIEHLRQSRL